MSQVLLNCRRVRLEPFTPLRTLLHPRHKLTNRSPDSGRRGLRALLRDLKAEFEEDKLANVFLVLVGKVDKRILSLLL